MPSTNFQHRSLLVALISAGVLLDSVSGSEFCIRLAGPDGGRQAIGQELLDQKLWLAYLALVDRQLQTVAPQERDKHREALFHSAIAIVEAKVPSKQAADWIL